MNNNDKVFMSILAVLFSMTIFSSCCLLELKLQHEPEYNGPNILSKPFMG